MPGIDLMRAHATDKDVLLIHERQYFDGLRWSLESRGDADLLATEFAAGTQKARSEVALSLALHPAFNKRPINRPTQGAPIGPDWLARLPLRFVSHLSPSVLERMHALAAEQPGSVINDLASLEKRLDFVPLGIDKRGHAGVSRVARRFRTERGLQQDDVLVGHFGLVLGDLKRLPDIIEAVAAHAAHMVRSPQPRHHSRRLFFALVGKVIDQALFEHARDLFRQAGLSGRLLHSNPKLETDFDVQIASCDAVFCLRRQTRGQLSHIFVRALSLGVPVIVNRESGYGFDPRLLLEDETLQDDIVRVLDLLLDGGQTVQDIRTRARQQYASVHRGSDSLRQILGKIDESVI